MALGHIEEKHHHAHKDQLQLIAQIFILVGRQAHSVGKTNTAFLLYWIPGQGYN